MIKEEGGGFREREGGREEGNRIEDDCVFKVGVYGKREKARCKGKKENEIMAQCD